MSILKRMKPARVSQNFPKSLRLVALTLIVAAFLYACETRSSSALKRIRSQGTLRVAIDPTYPPFEFVNSSGIVVGFDVDLAQEIGKRLGVQTQFISTGYDALYDALTVGRADVIISALYPDPWQTSGFVFSPPYFNAGEVLVVPIDSPIDEPTDLAGQHVSVVFGTEGHMEALRWERLLDPPPTVVPQESPDAVVAGLVSGAVEAGVVDNISAQMALSQTPTLRTLAPPVTDEIYVIAGRDEDAALIEEISKILQGMREDGTMEGLIAHWMQG
jgi:arginine/lysine/histidine transporter system substrate-binding protein